MARAPRVQSASGIYHVVFRGISRQALFEEDADREKMLEILLALKEELHFQIYAYCLMENHVHLLFHEQQPRQLTTVMKRLLVKYVGWFNRKYSRSGPLIENRYKSKPVALDAYFLALVRYIHQNPVRAGLARTAKEGRWSSYSEYFSNDVRLVDKELIFSMISPDEFEKFNQEADDAKFFVNSSRVPDDETMRRNLSALSPVPLRELNGLPKQARDEILQTLKCKCSIRQLERLTGISRGVIAKA